MASLSYSHFASRALVAATTVRAIQYYRKHDCSYSPSPVHVAGTRHCALVQIERTLRTALPAAAFFFSFLYI